MDIIRLSQPVEYRVNNRHVIRSIPLPDGTYFIRKDLIPFIKDNKEKDEVKILPGEKIEKLTDGKQVSKDKCYFYNNQIVVSKSDQTVDFKTIGKDAFFEPSKEEVVVGEITNKIIK